MTKDSLDLTGTWDGVFFYQDVPDAGPTTPFLAIINETSGAFSGTVIEPHEFVEGTISATIHGHRQDRKVAFSKDYETEDEDYQATVQYAGTLSEDGDMISGEWSIDHWTGTFEMTRSLGAAEMAVKQESVTVGA